MSNPKKLEVIRVSCVRQRKTLFADISFELTAGELFLIEGPNGSGKSSLLRLITGLATAYTGETRWYGERIEDQFLTYLENIHYLSHSNGIKLDLTVMENLQLSAHLSGLYEMVGNNLTTILDGFHLTPYKHTPARFLSAGQKRRLALTRLLMIPKALWILDEPLTALDKASQLFFLAELKKYLHQGGMAIISSHHSIQIDGIPLQALRLGAC